MNRRLAALVAGLPLVRAACGDKGSSSDAGKPGTPAPSGAGAIPASGQPSKIDASAQGYGYAAQLGEDLDRKAGDALQKGKKYLLGRRDDATGAWDPNGPVATGYTAFGTLAMISATPKESVASDPTIRKGLEFIRAKQQADGSIYSNKSFVNYETAVCVAAFATARIAEFAPVQAKARDFLVSSQVQGEAGNLSNGGFPYVSKSDPTAPADLSNAQFAATALHDAGLAKDSPVWPRLLAYLDTVQNRSESNTLVVKRHDKELNADVEIVSGNDGGAGYGPGMSKSGLVKRPDGKYEVRSYGSMTYALLKCLLFAGAKTDDPRVVAAVGWISKNFTVDRNPGFEQTDDAAKKGQQGYYYYLLTMSRALADYEKATGKPLAVTDAEGKSRDWRREVAAKLVALQKPDGSWQNGVERWDEGNPLLASAYAIQALAICQGRLP